jgi:hypothetical protein
MEGEESRCDILTLFQRAGGSFWRTCPAALDRERLESRPERQARAGTQDTGIGHCSGGGLGRFC